MLVFPDTNVLYRIRLADLLLRACAMHLFTLAWSDELLSELSRVLSKKKKLPREAVEGFIEAIKSISPLGRIDPSHYQHLVARMLGPDASDHVLSAAIRGGQIDILITDNLSDFPASDVGDQCNVCTPDEFFSTLIRKYPTEMNLIIREIIEQLIRPRLTLEELRQQYANSGLLEFARLIA
jgi:predicted nucleic acid-binding protein